MNITFSDGARAAAQRALQEALALGHEYVGPEHLLLGVVGDDTSLGCRALVSMGVTAEAVRAAVRSRTRPGAGPIDRSELPYTSLAKKAIEHAMAETRRLGQTWLDAGHVLQGLVMDARSPATQVLRSLGVERSRLDRALAALRADAGATSAEPVWFVELDASSAAPIYEQVIAQVEEAVATGRLATGERMPTVRDLAEELGTAPGTIARAYSELERRGVLETAGARGTYVARPSSKLTDTRRASQLEGLLRPVAIAGFHLGATADELRAALEAAMKGVL